MRLCKVIYDVDGVLYNLVEDFCERIGCPVPVTYDADKSIVLSDVQKKQLKALYRSPSAFSMLQPVLGARYIFRPEVLGLASVYIESNNFNYGVMSQKMCNLYRDLVDINWSHVHMMVVDVDSKEPVPDADVVIEDKPDTLYKYPDAKLRILIDHDYNRECIDSGIVRVPDLLTATMLVDKFLWKE